METNPNHWKLRAAPPGLGSRPEPSKPVSCDNAPRNLAERRKMNPNRSEVWVRLPGRVSPKRPERPRCGV